MQVYTKFLTATASLEGKRLNHLETSLSCETRREGNGSKYHRGGLNIAYIDKPISTWQFAKDNILRNALYLEILPRSLLKVGRNLQGSTSKRNFDSGPPDRPRYPGGNNRPDRDCCCARVTIVFAFAKYFSRDFPGFLQLAHAHLSRCAEQNRESRTSRHRRDPPRETIAGLVLIRRENAARASKWLA